MGKKPSELHENRPGLSRKGLSSSPSYDLHCMWSVKLLCFMCSIPSLPNESNISPACITGLWWRANKINNAF